MPLKQYNDTFKSNNKKTSIRFVTTVYSYTVSHNLFVGIRNIQKKKRIYGIYPRTHHDTSLFVH